jgi:hypothetical protein
MSLRKWTSEKWVDIANPKKGGGFPPCGRSKGEKRKKSSKARSMTASQRRAAVSRKKTAERRSRKGKKPNYAKT